MIQPFACLMGVDVGTTYIKAAAFEPEGRMLAIQKCVTPLQGSENRPAEYDADALWSCVADLIHTVIEQLGDKYRIESIAVASMGEAGTVIDGQGEVLFPIIPWFDTRTSQQAQWWQDEFGEEHIRSVTGIPIDPRMGVNKLLWIRQNHAEIFKKSKYWLSVADLIILYLSGVVVTDQSLASRTMVFDQAKRAWSQGLIEAAKLPLEMFPPALMSGSKVGEVNAQAAQNCGLVVGTPVVLGGHDHLCGAYLARQGMDLVVDSTGTAEVLIIPSTAYKPKGNKSSRYISCYADVIPNRYIYAAPVGYAGALVEWFRKKIAHRAGKAWDASNYSDLIALIPQPLEFSGIICNPAFGRLIGPAGEPAMILGALAGLTLEHNQGHILQALLEGNTFSLCENIEAVERIIREPIRKFRVEGGATRNPAWMQLKADVTGREVEALRLDEAVVLGVALLGGVGVGYHPDHQSAARNIDIQVDVYKPNPERNAIYRYAFEEIYIKFMSTLGPINRALKKFYKSRSGMAASE